MTAYENWEREVETMLYYDTSQDMVTYPNSGLQANFSLQVDGPFSSSGNFICHVFVVLYGILYCHSCSTSRYAVLHVPNLVQIEAYCSNTAIYNTKQHNAERWNAIPYNTIQFKQKIQYNTTIVQYYIMLQNNQCNTIQLNTLSTSSK